MKFKVNSDGTQGVTLTFRNGARLSIQSKPGDYCTPGESVELHAWGPNKEQVNVYGGKDTLGWVQVEHLPKYIRKVATWTDPLERAAKAADKACEAMPRDVGNGLRKVEEAIQAMEHTMLAYRDFGAQDTEPDGELHAAMIRALEHGVIETPVTGEHWQLFTASMDCREAARGLTRECLTLCKTIRDHRGDPDVYRKVRDYCWRV